MRRDVTTEPPSTPSEAELVVNALNILPLMLALYCGGETAAGELIVLVAKEYTELLIELNT